MTLTVTDTASQSDAVSHAVTVADGVGGPPCTQSNSYTNTLFRTGAVQYQPSGTSYYSSTTAVHRGWLRGPANANFGLRLQKRVGSSWTTVATSSGPTSEEQLAYNGTPGTYRGASTR